MLFFGSSFYVSAAFHTIHIGDIVLVTRAGMK